MLYYTMSHPQHIELGEISPTKKNHKPYRTEQDLDSQRRKYAILDEDSLQQESPASEYDHSSRRATEHLGVL